MINRILNRLGYTLINNDFLSRKYQEKKEFKPLDQLFYKHLHKDFFFVQIGANDGISHDPIYHLVTGEKVSGIALEPLPDIFKLLVKNYSGYPGVKLVNKAIHSTRKEMDLYLVNTKAGGHRKRVRCIESFRKDNHRLSGIHEDDMITVTVKCISFDKLLIEHKITHIDLLQLDTEGYDAEILRMIDFQKIRPGIISFEHGLHDGIMSKEEFQEIESMLMKQGYDIIILKRDAIAHARD